MTGKTEGLQYSAEYLAMKAKAMRTKAAENRAAGVPRKVKVVSIEATFPDLRGKLATPTGRGEASTVKAAAANAMRDLLSQVKGKKFTLFTATVSIGTKAVV